MPDQKLCLFVMCIGLIFVWEAFPYNFLTALQQHIAPHNNAPILSELPFNFYSWFLFVAACSMGGIFLGLLAIRHRVSNSYQQTFPSTGEDVASRNVDDKTSPVTMSPNIKDTVGLDFLKFHRLIRICGYAGVLIPFNWIFLIQTSGIWEPLPVVLVTVNALLTVLILLGWMAQMTQYSCSQITSVLIWSLLACSFLKFAESLIHTSFLSPERSIMPFISGVCLLLLSFSRSSAFLFQPVAFGPISQTKDATFTSSKLYVASSGISSS